MRTIAQWGKLQWGEGQWGSIEEVIVEIITPDGIASAEAFGTPVLFGPILPTGIPSEEAFGTPRLADLFPAGIASAEAFGFLELFTSPGATGTIEPSSITTLEAFGSATLTEDATLYPTGIPSAFDMDLHTVGAPVATIQPYGIPSEEAFGGDGLGAMSGPSVVTIETPPAPAPGTGSALNKKLCSPVGLSRADHFEDAPDPAFILPDVYGDFSEGGIRGPCPTVLVTRSFNFIYVAAAHPVQEISHVYVDDVEQPGGFATSVSFEIRPGVSWAVITMPTQATGPVSWRGKGRMDETGALIENPIDQLHTFLTHRCGYMADDFDAGALSEARAAATAAGWKTAWVFQDDRQVQDWITEIMFNVMGIWRVSGRGQLQLSLDVGGTPEQIDIVASVVAARDCLDGDDGVTWVADRDHLVNQLQAYYLYGWALGQPSSRLVDLEEATSVNAYGELRKSVTLRGHRIADQVRAWAQILFERQSFAHRVEGAIIAFRTSASALAHVTTGDLIAFTWPYGPRRELGNPYTNQLLRVLTVSHEFAQGGVTSITAVDTGTFVNIAGVRVLEPLAL